MAHIRLRGVSFAYPVYEVTARSLKVSLVRRFSSRSGVIHIPSLTDVSFDIESGDRVGLIGRNGAGKSTMLKMLAGVIAPDSGVIDIEGRVISLISKGLGISSEYSGRRNIELPMRLLGATDAEVERARRDIPEWTGLGPFMDLPVRTYSDGMRARLNFAISTAVRGDILLLDEWLGAGDAEFVDKAQERMNALVDSTSIVVLASHSIELVRRLCNKLCWLEHGRLILAGDADVVLNAYLRDVHIRRELIQAVA
jgi:ABC-2 type transport system ATP-binding protein/lipopolysaccharide transport system ATP-binding protein